MSTFGPRRWLWTLPLALLVVHQGPVAIGVERSTVFVNDVGDVDEALQAERAAADEQIAALHQARIDKELGSAAGQMQSERFDPEPGS